MNQNDTDASENKKETSAYPYTSLVVSLKIADAVKELGGARSSIPKSRLAAHLKEADKSASFLQRVTAAKAFGLIDGRSDYSLTDLAKRYYFPTSEFDKSNALLDCLGTPTTYREIIRRYDGDKLPDRAILENIFHIDLKVPDSWKARAAAFFVSSAQFAGVIDGEGFLRFSAAKQPKPETHPNLVPSNAPFRSVADRPKLYGGGEAVPIPTPGTHMFVLPLDKDNKRKITVVAPLDVTPKEVQRIQKWLEFSLLIEADFHKEE